MTNKRKKRKIPERTNLYLVTDVFQLKKGTMVTLIGAKEPTQGRVYSDLPYQDEKGNWYIKVLTRYPDGLAEEIALANYGVVPYLPNNILERFFDWIKRSPQWEQKKFITIIKEPDTRAWP